MGILLHKYEITEIMSNEQKDCHGKFSVLFVVLCTEASCSTAVWHQSKISQLTWIKGTSQTLPLKYNVDLIFTVNIFLYYIFL